MLLKELATLVNRKDNSGHGEIADSAKTAEIASAGYSSDGDDDDDDFSNILEARTDSDEYTRKEIMADGWAERVIERAENTLYA